MHLSRSMIGPDRVRGPCFPTGLILFVMEGLKKEGHSQFELIPMQKQPELACNPTQLDEVNLRDYQQETIEVMKKESRGILHLATGGGKTLLSAAFTQQCGLPVLFVVYGISLVQQTCDYFNSYMKTWLEQTGHKVGMITGTVHDPQYITIASSSSLVSMKKRNPEKFKEFVSLFDVLFFDETHQLGADNFYNVCMDIPAFYRFGLSGTPTMRGDNANLRVFAVTGPIIQHITNKQLIDSGVLAKTTIEFIPVNKIQGAVEPILTLTGDALGEYQQQYKRCIITNAYRNNLICVQVQKWIRKEKQVVILIKEIEHGNILKQMLDDLGVKNEFVFGKVGNREREKLKQRFRDGELRVLIASTIFDQGIDLPCIDVLILGGSGKSHIKTLQRIGRGLRGEYLHVIDFADRTHKMFTEQARYRMRQYQHEQAFSIIFSKEYI